MLSFDFKRDDLKRMMVLACPIKMYWGYHKTQQYYKKAFTVSSNIQHSLTIPAKSYRALTAYIF